MSGHALQRKQAHALSGPTLWITSFNWRTITYPKVCKVYDRRVWWLPYFLKKWGLRKPPCISLKTRSAAVDRLTSCALPLLFNITLVCPSSLLFASCRKLYSLLVMMSGHHVLISFRVKLVSHRDQLEKKLALSELDDLWNFWLFGAVFCSLSPMDGTMGQLYLTRSFSSDLIYYWVVLHTQGVCIFN